jgi:hypothetical protein
MTLYFLRCLMQAALLAAAFIAANGYPESRAEAVTVDLYTLPFVDPAEISCGWHCYYDPIYGWHLGTDYLIGNPNVGGEVVMAGGPGGASRCPRTDAAGHSVVMNHENGHRSRYLHFDTPGTPPPWPSTQTMDRGWIVGFEGSDGVSTGPHLHFETRVNATTFSCGFDGTAQDPYGSTGYYLWTLNPPGYPPVACNYPVDSASGPGRYPGVFRPKPEGTQWHERYSNTGGSANRSFDFATTCDIPVVGDWNNDGVDTPGVFRADEREWHLSNSVSGQSPFVCVYGQPTDFPVVGDWDGDGDDNIGIYRPSNRGWYLDEDDPDSDCDGAHSITPFSFGGSGDRPITGDWDNDDVVEAGVYRPSDSSWHLKSANTGASGLVVSPYVYGQPWDYPLSGDWDWDGDDTPGLFRTSGGTPRWLLKNNLGGGSASVSFDFGVISDKPITGDWN